MFLVHGILPDNDASTRAARDLLVTVGAETYPKSARLIEQVRGPERRCSQLTCLHALATARRNTLDDYERTRDRRLDTIPVASMPVPHGAGKCAVSSGTMAT